MDLLAVIGNRVKLISIDCWDTVLVNPRGIHERIDQLIAEFIHKNFRSLPLDKLDAAIKVEADEFLNHLERPTFPLTSSDRAMRVLTLAGVATTDSLAQHQLANALNDAVDDTLLELPTEPLPNVIEFLQNAADALIPVAMISNTDWLSPRVVTSAIRNLALESYFSDLLFSGDGYLPKPHPHMFTVVLDRHRCDPANAVHLGDNLAADDAGAIKVGMRSIALTNEAFQNTGKGVRYRARSFCEAILLVNSLCSGLLPEL